jgi:hypothetical protein
MRPVIRSKADFLKPSYPVAAAAANDDHYDDDYSVDGTFGDEEAAVGDDESCHIAAVQDNDNDDMDLENDEKDFVLPVTSTIVDDVDITNDDELRRSLLWCNTRGQLSNGIFPELEPECPIQQAAALRPTILKRRRSPPSNTNDAPLSPSSPNSSSSCDEDDDIENMYENEKVSSAAKERERRLCTTPPRVKNNGSCSRALDAAITCLSSLLP